MARPLIGDGGKGRAILEKKTFFKTKKKIIKLEGGGGKALMAWPLVEELFIFF